jgi:hypothetical protein
MKQSIVVKNSMDRDGNPAGGSVYLDDGEGMYIDWQDGPLKDSETGERTEPNGAFVETVIDAALSRLEFYQRSKFACDYNQRAIEHLQKALEALEERTADRESRNVEGTHEI